MKRGYKQSEVGVIPEDWDLQSLGELGHFRNGINKAKEDFGHGLPFVNLMDVFGGSKVLPQANLGLVKSSPTERKHYGLRGGDVLFVRSSVKPEGVGLTALVPEDLPNTVFSGFLIRYRDKGQLALEFKEHCFHQPRFRNRLIAKSTVSANANVNQDALKALQIAFPRDKDEQRAIATILSGLDAQVTALNKLIAKKRDLRDAVMQQLVTGRVRLPGNWGKWQVTLLGDVSLIKTGKKNNEDKVEDGQYPFFVRSQTVERINSYSFDGEAILVPGEGGIGIIFHYINGRFDYHQRVYKISDFDSDLFGKFVYYYMIATFNKQATRNSVKATVDSLRLPTFQEFEVLAPKRDEQVAIATVLSVMGDDLVALEQLYGKYRCLKQAMMQELLTGRTRLL